MVPLISILLPSRNPGRFLKERLDSIWAQSISDWELIIVDSDSTDGSLAVFQELAAKDSRVTLYTRPPGLYQAWNFAIRQARGKYVYIATADDTMRSDALEKMSAALEKHPECGFCDSRLRVIDANGREIRELEDNYLGLFWHLSYPQECVHIRKSPADFFVHLGGKTVYSSVTQLLIRRDLFEKTGLFPEDYGPSGDYMWGMRAALCSDVIFLPETLSSWRIHDAQATFAMDVEKVQKNFLMMVEMARQVLREVPAEIAAAGKIVSRLVLFKSILCPARKNHCTLLQKGAILWRALRQTPGLSLEFLLTLPWYLLKVPCKFLFIYTYAKMICRHTKHFYRGKIVICKEPSEGRDGEKDLTSSQPNETSFSK